jgi:phosphatidate cytidylyltransferase
VVVSPNKTSPKPIPKPVNKFAGLVQRVRTALVLLPFVIAPAWLGGNWFLLLMGVAALAMAYEWVGLLKSQNAVRDRLWLGALLLAVLAYSHGTTATDGLAMIFVMLLGGGAVLVHQGARLTPVLGGLVYIGWPLAAAIGFRQDPLGMLIVGYALLSVWAVDVFAMFSGKLIGGPKLAPRLSPNKTWAGLIGGALGAVLAAWVSYWAIGLVDPIAVDLAAILMIGVVLAVLAQMSDLFESGLKRKYDIKDSGGIIPGHGGILDRVDGLIGVLIVLHIVSLWRGGQAATSLWVW